MIVIEGSDHLGKTTAAKELCRITDRVYVHMGVPPGEWDYHEDFMRIVQARPKCVQDRFHLGGLVYGKLLGCHGTKIEFQKFERLQHQLRNMRVLVITMFSGSDTWFEEKLESSHRDQMYSREIIMSANAIFRGLKADFMYDVSQDGYPDDYTLQMWARTARDFERHHD